MCCRRRAPLERKSTKMASKVWDYYGSSSSCQGKAKQSREDLWRKNFKRVCEELNKVGELLREVLNVRSSAKLDMLCLANASCRNPGPVILWVRHLSFTCVDKRHITWCKGGAVWFSINHDWMHMHNLEPSKQMYVALLPAYPCTAQTNKIIHC